MGEVYRARDERLDRDVAIKVLPAAVASDPKALARFEREAKAVAALSHPNILTIFDFGTDGGVTYAVTELLEGETLRSRLASGRIPQKDALDYALQIVRGLAAAHERGVVHRDIKPENIFVAPRGHVKILDFGLAKLEEGPPPGDQTNTPTASVHTDAGTVMGTVGYMSPEQAMGEVLDARSDIFSFGAVLYEMLSGSRPFSRPTVGGTIAAILKDDPPELSESGGNVSPLLDRVVRHCLEKDRNRRFQSAQDIAFALLEASEPSVSRRGTAFRAPSARWKTLVAAGLLIALAIAGAGYVLLRGSHRAAAREVKRVAVLPFENLGAPEDDYFADGMSDAVRGKLTSLPGIEVIARGSSVGYKRTSKSPKQIANELGAPYLLMATVRWQKAGERSRVQISPELVQVKRSGAPASRWQQTFDASLTDVFQVQADVATRVAEALGVALGAAEQKEISQRPTQNLAAYDAYLRAVENENRFYLKEARQGFENALALDPKFAMAMLGLARQSSDESDRAALLKRAAQEEHRLTELERLHVEMAISLNEKRPDDGFRIASEINRKYPADIRSAQVLAGYQSGAGHADGAIKILEDLLRTDPNNAEAHNQLGYFHGYQGDYEKALEMFKRYQTLMPDTANPFDSMGELQAYSGHYREALESLNRALAIRPDFAESFGHIAVTYEGLGEYARAIAQYERAAAVTDDPDARRAYLSRAGVAAHHLGDEKETARLFRKAKAVRSEGRYAELDAVSLDAAVALAEGRWKDAQKLLLETEQKREALWKEDSLPGARPHFPGVNHMMALALEGEGKPAAALEYWKKNAFPPSPSISFEDRRTVYEARAKVAVALARKGDFDGADKLLAQNRKWNPSWAPTRPDELEVQRLRQESGRAAAY